MLFFVSWRLYNCVLFSSISSVYKKKEANLTTITQPHYNIINSCIIHLATLMKKRKKENLLVFSFFLSNYISPSSAANASFFLFFLFCFSLFLLLLLLVLVLLCCCYTVCFVFQVRFLFSYFFSSWNKLGDDFIISILLISYLVISKKKKKKNAHSNIAIAICIYRAKKKKRRRRELFLLLHFVFVCVFFYAHMHTHTYISTIIMLLYYIFFCCFRFFLLASFSLSLSLYVILLRYNMM